MKTLRNWTVFVISTLF